MEGKTILQHVPDNSKSITNPVPMKYQCVSPWYSPQYSIRPSQPGEEKTHPNPSPIQIPHCTPPSLIPDHPQVNPIPVVLPLPVYGNSCIREFNGPTGPYDTLHCMYPLDSNLPYTVAAYTGRHILHPCNTVHHSPIPTFYLHSRSCICSNKRENHPHLLSMQLSK